MYVFYSFHTSTANYQELSGLQQNTFIISQFHRFGLYRVSRGQHLGMLYNFLEAPGMDPFQTYVGFWLNSVPWRLKSSHLGLKSVSLLPVNWGWSLLLEDTYIFFLKLPMWLFSIIGRLRPFHTLNLFDFSFCCIFLTQVRENSPLLRAHVMIWLHVITDEMHTNNPG